MSNKVNSNWFEGELQIDSNLNPQCYCYVANDEKCYELRQGRPGVCACECHERPGDPDWISDEDMNFDDQPSDEQGLGDAGERAERSEVVRS